MTSPVALTRGGASSGSGRHSRLSSGKSLRVNVSHLFRYVRYARKARIVRKATLVRDETTNLGSRQPGTQWR